MEDKNDIFKKEIEIESDKNIVYSLQMSFDSELAIIAKELNKDSINIFKGNYNEEYIKENKYFKSCDNTHEIKTCLKEILKKNENITLKEELNKLNLILKLNHCLTNQIKFLLKKEKQEEELKKNELQDEYKQKSYEMINNLKEEISTIKQEMKKMSEIIESQKKVIDEQQDKLEFQQSQIDYLKLLSGFKEIENPWSNEKFKYGDYQLFNYTLKENDYLVEKSDENQNMHLIKSKNRLKPGKIYKIEFRVNYINGGKIDIGFGDFNEVTNQKSLRNKCKCFGLTEEGMFNEGFCGGDFKVNANYKRYDFIIDVDNQKLSLYVYDQKIGEYRYYFNQNIFVFAGVEKSGNSIHISTYEKDNYNINC